MAETAITTVLAKVGELAAWEAAVLFEVGDDVRLLRDKLEWMHTFIRDADRRRRLREDEFVGVWVRQTRDVAFEAEDAIDDFFHRADLASLGYQGWRAWTAGCASCGTHLTLRHGLSGRIQMIRKRLDEISANRDVYKIEHAPTPAWASSSSTTLAAWDDLEEHVIGFDDYVETLKGHLLDPEISRRAMVSIVGESGIGKTTLARKVYDSPDIRNHFEIRTWTILPPKSRPTDVLHDIHKQASLQVPRLSQTGEENDAACRGRDIGNMLHQHLIGRRYLVVVDGTIAITDWNSLRASLPDESNGSRVLLITESESKEVIRYADPTFPPLELNRLNPKDSYEVFRRKVFGQEDCPKKHRARYYRDVFQITRGLPLSVVVLAGLLRSKELPSEWDELMAQLATKEKSKNAKMIMSLSFDDLPHHLKSCFLYFAAMQECTVVDAQTLVRLWIAEGFVRPKKGKTMEEVGQKYLKELISRCMVQLVRKDDFGDVQTVIVQDFLHAFAQDEAQEASFIEIHDSTDILAPGTVRRLSLHNYTDKYVSLSNSFPKLRSVICDLAEHRIGNGRTRNYVQSHCFGFLHASKFLRVIDIRGLGLKRLPNAIGSMIHLRYLGLQCRNLQELPKSIGNLLNLQSFILKSNNVKEVADAFWKIPTLRHIIARFTLPKSVGNLHNLQTLHGMQPCVSDQLSKALGKMVNLRSLELNGLTASHADALTSALENLELLVHLALQGESLPSSIFSIASLRCLQSLKLLGRMDEPRGPDHEYASNVRYIRPNLSRISMWDTLVHQEFITMLAELPSLAELTMMSDSYDGADLAFPDVGFRSLRALKLGLSGLEEWRIGQFAMPNLARLTFLRCAMMRMLPDTLEQMKNLNEVVLYGMPGIVERISEGREDYHKIKHVAVIQTIW